MVPSSLPRIIWEKCEEFVVNFAENEELADVTSRILGSLNNSWNNPAFSSEFAKSQNKGTYVTNVIVPAIQATLKGLVVLCQQHNGKKYELIYVESSHLSCTPQKEKDDEIKL
ncbi:hypothetical protein GLOIN_2v1779907 [Rhizophagus clarus]|uniref:Uncharacterized protein n=1 Tax=Rhizophagus clarus TaxID=94130 RepID=A0A8H3MFF2_9GLOM|nr:hypothetical protein GLOIN_2v1779907 [Rhizophagus clarus]